MLYPISLIIACCPRRSGYSLELCQLWFLLSVIRRWIQDLVSISVGKVIYDYVLLLPLTSFESFPVTRWTLELYVSANLGYVATPHFFKLHFLTLGYFCTQKKFLRVRKASSWFWILAWFLTQSRLDVLLFLLKTAFVTIQSSHMYKLWNMKPCCLDSWINYSPWNNKWGCNCFLITNLLISNCNRSQSHLYSNVKKHYVTKKKAF